MTYSASRRAIVLVLFVLSTVAFPHLGKASLQDELAKKKAIQDSIAASNAQKKQQQAVLGKLNAEVANLNGQITATQSTINTIIDNVGKTNRTISDLTGNINTQVTELNAENDKLQAALNNMYIAGAQSNPVLVLVESDSISTAVADLQSYQSLESEIENKAKHIEELKASLEKSRADAEKEKANLQSLQEQATAQKHALDSQKALKQELSTQTVQSIGQIDGTIGKYRNDLEAVDGRITEFLAAIRQSDGYVAAAGDFVVANSQPWHMYQTDPRWANTPLDPGSSGSDSFAESGCLVTAISMVANRYGFSGTPPQILSQLRAAGGMFGDLVAWGGVSDAFHGQLGFMAGGKEPLNAHLLDASLANNQPVIVHIRRGVNGHWIVVSAKVGDKYAVEDPYFQTGRVYPAGWIDYMARLVPGG